MHGHPFQGRRLQEAGKIEGVSEEQWEGGGGKDRHREKLKPWTNQQRTTLTFLFFLRLSLPQNSKTLWGNCSKPKFAGFCDETCGRCASTWKIVPGTETASSNDKSGITRSASLAPVVSTQTATLGPDLENVSVEFEQVSETILRVKIASPGRWEIPRSIFRNVVEQPLSAKTSETPVFDVDVAANPFSFAVKRANFTPGEDSTVFDTTGTRLVLKDQYLELSSSLPASSRLYGLGESTSTTGLLLPRDGRPHTLWNHDSPAAYPGVNMYGSWPVLLDVRAGGLSHGILLMNSNGMDVSLSADRLTYRAIGGVLDFYIFMGPTPNDVVDQLTQVVGEFRVSFFLFFFILSLFLRVERGRVFFRCGKKNSPVSLSLKLSNSSKKKKKKGRPWLPPYWSLGLMQSKYGYQSIEECETAVDGYREAKIPLETFVSDSQYMVRFFCFFFPFLFLPLFFSLFSCFFFSIPGGLEREVLLKWGTEKISLSPKKLTFPPLQTLPNTHTHNQKKGRRPGLHPGQALPAAPHESLRRQASRQRPEVGPDPRPRDPRPQRVQALRRRDEE